MLKSFIRTKNLQLRKNIPHLRRCLWQKKVVKNFLKLLKTLKHVQTIGVYEAFGSEISTKLLQRVLQNKGYKLYVCKMTTFQKNLVFIPLFFSNGDWKQKLDLKKEEVFFNFVPDLVIVPLLGFDIQKNRVGYGQGYYDRFFQKHPTLSVGLGYEILKVKQITTEKTDYALNYIVSEVRIY